MAVTKQRREGRVPAISRPLLVFFLRIVRGQFQRRFHAVRLAGAEHAREIESALDGPLIVYANHVGWWDPMVSFLLASVLMPGRRHYAPMDAEALKRYPILRWLGIFPVELASARGAVQFLRTGEAILRAGGVLWVTPQGRFADVRERPIAFKAGLAALAKRVPGCRLLPLAIEYTFWEERTPETLLLLRAPVPAERAASAAALETELIAALEGAMEELRERAMARKPEGFERVLLRGGAGVGGFYAVGQRLKAWVRGERYRPEHSAARSLEGAASARSLGRSGGGASLDGGLVAPGEPEFRGPGSPPLRGGGA